MQSDPDMLARRKIMSLLDRGDLGDDGRLPSERALAERFGVARRRIRQALADLEAEGLIWRRQGSGTYAGSEADPTGELAAKIVGETNALQVMEARLCIEPELAALCARRIEPGAVDRLRGFADRIHVDKTHRENELWDSALHRLIAQQAGNRPLLTSYAMLDEIRNNSDWLRFRARARTRASAEQAIRQHTLIVDAIADRDADAARAAMRDHLDIRFRALQAEATEPG